MVLNCSAGSICCSLAARDSTDSPTPGAAGAGSAVAAGSGEVSAASAAPVGSGASEAAPAFGAAPSVSGDSEGASSGGVGVTADGVASPDADAMWPSGGWGLGGVAPSLPPSPPRTMTTMTAASSRAPISPKPTMFIIFLLRRAEPNWGGMAYEGAMSWSGRRGGGPAVPSLPVDGTGGGPDGTTASAAFNCSPRASPSAVRRSQSVAAS